MKRLFFILMIALFWSSLSAQCPQVSITLSTQQDVDDFAANYPGCTEIGNNVQIKSPSSITNLNGLNQITSIGGDLIIQNNGMLLDLTGLTNLNSIGDRLSIISNDNLVNLEGLESLYSIRNLYIQNNASLLNISQLGSMTTDSVSRVVIEDNPTLTNINGLESITTVENSLIIENNQSLNNLNGLTNLNYVSSEIIIRDNSTLNDISGLYNVAHVGANFRTNSNPLITSISGFNNLTYVGGTLQIFGNDNLTSITGFNNLVAFGSGYFAGLNLRSNAILNDISGFSTADFTGARLQINDNPNLAICALPSICNHLLNGEQGGVGDNAPGCATSEEVIAECSSEFCLTEGITFTTQTQIDNFAADYAGCIEVLGGITVNDSGIDPITNLDGLNQIAIMNGSLNIQNNPSLTNLNGIANIDYTGFTDVQIQNNPNLSICNTPNICNYVTFNTTAISGNASGCNTQAQIIASCAPVDGGIDTDFGTDGIIDIAGHTVSCILTQPDDKLVVFGSSLLRFHPDGTLDTSFGSNGVVSFTGYEGVLQPDGKIIVLSAYALARFNPDGTFDTTFGSSGIQGLSASAKDIALSPDGKIITSDTELARYNADGSPDTTFGDNGVVSIEVQAYHYGEYPGAPQVLRTYYPSCHVIVKSDGKIVVAGDFAYQSRYNPEYIIYYNRLRMRLGYNADGTLDSDFNDWIEGWYQGDVFSSVDDLVLLPDDEFVMLSSTDFETEGNLCMNQYDANGASLGGNCSYTSLCEDSFYYGASWSRAEVADCGIFAFGEYGTIFGNTCNFLTRTDYDGTPNGDFGDNGGVPLPLAAAFNNTADIALQSDGSIIVAGNSATGIALARLYNDETCNPIFPTTIPPNPTDPCGGSESNTDSLTHIFDQDLFIDAVGFANNPTVTFTDPGTAANAVLSDISLELYFRLNGNSCENEIAIQITDPAGNTQPLTAYTTCDGGTGLYYVNLNIPSGNTTGTVEDWLVEFDDTNNQNSSHEYSVRFARLNYVATTGGSGETIVNEVSDFADSDLFIDGVGFENNGTYTFADPGTPANAVLSDISLELYFRLNGSSCENEIALQITDPAGNTQALTAYTTCDGGTGLYYVNLDVPSGNTTGSAADWTVQFDDTNDQNSDYEYSVRFGRLTYTTTHTEGGGGTLVTVNESVSEYADSDLFIDGVGFENNGTYTFADPGTPSDAVLSDISLELYFRLNGSSCENEIALQITDPAGNTQALTAFTTCDGVTGLYYVNLDVPNGNTTGDIADWVVQFDDTNDQNSDYEYSVRFGRLTYNTEYTECVPMLLNENNTSTHQHINTSAHENVSSQYINTLKLFPVPASQHLNVEYFSETNNPTNIEIISNEGKTLMSQEEFSQEGINIIQLDIADLPAGHYHIRMYNANNVQMQSFVKIMP